MTLRVTCAIIVNEDQVLCAQRGPTMALPLQWEFPGGKIEDGESPENCILREIREELNLDLKILENAPSSIHPLGTGKILELIPFVCVVVGGQLQIREHAEVRWCTAIEMGGLQWAAADVAILDWWRVNSARIQKALATA